MKSFLMTVTALLILSGHNPLLAQVNSSPGVRQGRSLQRAARRPDLGIDYSLGAKLKLVSRKSTYRLGEMITLDLALLNTSGETISYKSLKGPGLNVVDSGGRKIDAVQAFPFYMAATPDAYSLLKPKEIMIESYLLLAGCEGTGNLIDWGADLSGADIFEKELFVNRGQACLKTARPGEYTITAQLSNQFVLITESGKVKTAVGTITSTPLRIVISQ